jgi:hypothetical protein
MEFGLLKTKIEKMLIESYKNDAIKRDVFVFNEFIVKNKNLSKLYYLYDELNSNKGLNESLADEFINQSIVIYENLINKIKPSELKEIQLWVGHLKCENEYKNVDKLLSTNVTNILGKIEGKKLVKESLMKNQPEKKEVSKIPLKSMVEIANQTIEKYLDTLTESEKNEVKNLLSKDEKSLMESFYVVKGSVIGKLEKLQEGEQDKEVSEKINETIKKVKDETFDKMTYVKLQKLNENL